MNRYVFFKVIGRGTFGIVYKGFDKALGIDVAIKQTAKTSSCVGREYEVLKEVQDCSNCVKLIDVFYSYTKELCEFLVFEYLPYSLKDFIYSSQYEIENKEEKIKFIFKEIIKGLQQLHSHGIIHRDLKPENILLDSCENPKIVKICDMGSAKHLSETQKNPYVVSSFYRAPELLFASLNYSSSIDIWAAGCILAEMLLKRPLFYCCQEGELFCLQVKELGKPEPQTIKLFSDQAEVQFNSLSKAIDLLSKRFESRSNKILSNISKVSRGFYKVIKILLSWDPSKRPDASSILKYKLLY